MDTANADELIHQAIGLRIREARQARRMSLEQLGGGELSRSFLSLVERGRSRISLRALGIVAKRLDLPMRYFIEGLDEAANAIPPSAPEWTVEVHRPSPDRLRIELRLDSHDLVGQIGVHVPAAHVHLDLCDGVHVVGSGDRRDA